MVSPVIKKLKKRCDNEYNCGSLTVDRKDLLDILDYIRRLENLNIAQSAYIDQQGGGVKCNHCPFIDKCIFNPGEVSDCQLRMCNKGQELNHAIC